MQNRSVLGVCLFLSLGSSGFAASLTAVGPLPGDTVTELFAVSADGSVVAGRSWLGIGDSRAIRWTVEGGTEALPVTPGGVSISGVAYGVSGDGNYIVGHTGDDPSFRWSGERGVEIIGGAFANAASYDGSVVVGQTIGPDRRAFRWSDSDGFLDLGNSRALGVTADGRIVVGQTTTPAGGFFRWTAEGGSVELGLGIAQAISADGTTIVGGGAGSAFVWREAEGISPIGGNVAYAVNADGSVIVGEGKDAFGDWHATLVHSQLGSRDLVDVLRCQGGNVAGWNLTEATGISADGLTIVGNGTGPGGNRYGWVARLDPIAHPGDANRDGKVDLEDLNLVRNYFGLEGEPVPGDTNYDCAVTLDDLNAVRNNFGWVAPQPVPEPSSLALLAGAALVGGTFRVLRCGFPALRLLFVVLGMLVALHGHAIAGYSFTMVAGRAGDVAGFPLKQPSISDSGAVVFDAYLPNGRQAYFTAIDGVVSQVPLPHVDDHLYAPAVINSNGDVAAVVMPTFGTKAVVLVHDGEARTIDFGFGYATDEIDLNDSGFVAYHRANSAFARFLIKSDGITEQVVASSLMPGFRSLQTRGPSINERGEVAFWIGSDSPHPEAVLVGIGGEIDRGNYLLDLPEPRSNAFSGDPAINDNGELAIWGSREINWWEGSTLTQIATDAGEFALFQRPSINNRSTIGFYAALDDGSEGIFVGKHGIIETVLRSGDALNGSTVRSLRLGTQHSMNNRDEFAFWALLNDGREGVFIATPSMEIHVGDTNGDGKVDLEDLNNVRNNFGGSGSGDADSDGDVDLDDLNAVRNNFGVVRDSTSVPEPSSIEIVGVSLLLAVVSCWRPTALNRGR